MVCVLRLSLVDLLEPYVNLLVSLVYLVVHLFGVEFSGILLILIEALFKPIIAVSLRAEAAAAPMGFSHSIGVRCHLVCVEDSLSAIDLMKHALVMVLITKRKLSR